jgi:hypothetical protein
MVRAAPLLSYFFTAMIISPKTDTVFILVYRFWFVGTHPLINPTLQIAFVFKG